MQHVSTPAIVLSAIRYGETSKIVRLATRDAGIQSAIAKGALRSRSRFGAALQVLSAGTAQYLAKDHRELHVLTGFELTELHAGLASQVERYAAALVLAELMLRMAPAAGHADSFDALAHGVAMLAVIPAGAVESYAIRAVWQQLVALGVGPMLDRCAIDGTRLPDGPLRLGVADGGALCPSCAGGRPATVLPVEAGRAFRALLDTNADLPILDGKHAAAHRRLLSRWIQFHAGESPDLTALGFWLDLRRKENGEGSGGIG
jgi:DNA repair protein RecO (recombination protein O)